MVKVYHVKKAAKSNKKLGIKKGQQYWWWTFYPRIKRVSLRPPRPSQLTRSPFLQSILVEQERMEDELAGIDSEDTEASKDALVEAMAEIASEIENIKDKCEEKVTNIEEKFPNGCPTLELMQERVEHCLALIMEIESAISEVEVAETVEEIEEAVNGISWEVG